MFNKLKPILLMLLGVGVGLGLVAGVLAARAWLFPPPHQWQGLYLDEPREAFDFQLQTAGEAAVKLSDYRGKLVVLFFGYRSCPDVCPLTLANVERALTTLGSSAADVQVIMISVDPERDAPDDVAAYAQAFSPQFVGVTGSMAQLTEVAQAYNIYFAKEESTSASGYLVTHSSIVTVIDTAGKIRLVWPFGVESSAMAADLNALLAR
jgi:protein SCO1/2